MNELELKTYCLEHAGETLPAEAEARMQRDPELKKQVERLILVKKIISLKQYEQPHPSCTLRCIRAVNARIEQDRQSPIQSRLREWFGFEQPAQRWAYGAAALLIGMVGAGLFVSGGSSDLVVAEADVSVPPPAAVMEISGEPDVVSVELAMVPEAIAEEEQLAAVAPNIIPSSEKPLIMLRVGADFPAERGRMKFGGEASTPVSFEY